MKKQTSLFGSNPIEELDLQHQGSIGGEQLANMSRRNLDVGRSNYVEQAGQSELAPGREPAEGTEPWQQQSSDRPPTEGEEQKKTEKIHHYK